MSQDCTFYLKVTEENKETVQEAIELITGLDFYYLKENKELYQDEFSWWDYKDDMKKLSKKIPDTVFQLTVDCQGLEDIFRFFYKNGKEQGGRAKIVYPEYQEEEELIRVPIHSVLAGKQKEWLMSFNDDFQAKDPSSIPPPIADPREDE